MTDPNKKIAKVWTFQSDSNPNRSYQTLQYTDGSTSCNCKGWTQRVQRTAAGDMRSCKHTRDVDMGEADKHCSSTQTYSIVKVKRPTIINNEPEESGTRRRRLIQL